MNKPRTPRCPLPVCKYRMSRRCRRTEGCYFAGRRFRKDLSAEIGFQWLEITDGIGRDGVPREILKPIPDWLGHLYEGLPARGFCRCP
ncbi:hypothetical protein ES702_05112 [subsurface metagenome]